jgi:integration host factor subunit beta
METITKKDLVNYITDSLTRKEARSTESLHLSEDQRATKVRVTKVLVKEVIQSFLDKITEELARGNRLEFREFGVFEVKDRAPRRAQNPRTLEKVQVPAKRVVKFKVGRKMREMVENSKASDAPSVETPNGGSSNGEASATS